MAALLIGLIVFTSGVGVGVLAAPPSGDGIWSGDWFRESCVYVSNMIQLAYTTPGRLLIAGPGGNVTTDSGFQVNTATNTLTIQNTTFTGYLTASQDVNILGNLNVTGTSYLGATWLGGALDANGQDITDVDDLNATDVHVFNLYANSTFIRNEAGTYENIIQGIWYPKQGASYTIFKILTHTIAKNNGEWFGYTINTNSSYVFLTTINTLGAAGGGQIFVCSGTYDLPSASSFTISQNNITIRGEDRNSVIFKVPDGATALRYFYITGDNVKLLDFTVDGNILNIVDYAIEKYQDGIHYESGADYGLVQNVYVKDCSGMGIFSRGSYTKILDCNVQNTWDSQIQVNGNFAIINGNHCIGGAAGVIGGGIELEVGYGNTVTSNILESTIQGLRITSSSYNVVSDIVVKGSTAIGAYIGTNSNHNRVKNLQLYLCAYGLNIVGTDATHTVDNEVDGGVIYDPVNTDCVLIEKGAQNVVKNLYLFSPPRYAVNLLTTTYAKVLACTAFNTGSSHAIQLTTTTYSDIWENTIGSGTAIVELAVDCDYNSYTGNRGGDPIEPLGAHDKVYENFNFVSASSGTATILNATTSIAFANGLSATPLASWFSITFTENPTNPTGNWWLTCNATHAVLNVAANPGASNLDFSWQARKP